MINRKSYKMSIISITPPNVQESNYIHRPVHIENKMKLEIIKETKDPIIIANTDSMMLNTSRNLVSATTKNINQCTPVYINSSFNWIHYLILNYDVFVKHCATTPQQAFEHWVKFGMREKRRVILYDDEISSHFYLYTVLQKNIGITDSAFECKKRLIEKTPLFEEYLGLFHKYQLRLRNPTAKMIYYATKVMRLVKKNVCAIHCHDLNVFVPCFKEYLKQISDFFDIIVTYNLDNENVRSAYNITFILVQSVGHEVGGKFVAVDYLKSLNIAYDFVFFLNSTIDKHQKNEHVSSFISKLEIVQYFLKHDKSLGGVFPDTLVIGDNNLNFITNRLERIINTENYKLINWGENSLYVSELQNYLGIDGGSYIHNRSNYYILHKSVAEMVFGDKTLYNILNDDASFDYNWVNLQYKVDGDYETVYREYKINNWFGNAREARLGKKGVNESTIEYAFDKIIISAVTKCEKKIKITGTRNINASTEQYVNDFSIEKTKFADFCYLKSCFVNANDKFDWEIYLLLNKDLEKNGIVTEAKVSSHWHNIGKKEGRAHYDPNFDWEMYLLLNADVKTSGIDTKKQAYKHWINYGKKEKRKVYDPEFDWEQYLLLYPDLLSNGYRTKIDAYKHWIYCGQKENRICKIDSEKSEDFNENFYFKKYADLKENGIVTKEQLYMHWIKNGKAEHRIASIKPLEVLYNNILKHKIKPHNCVSNLNIKSVHLDKNDNYVVLKCTDEPILCSHPHFKNMDMVTKIDFNKWEHPCILIVDFDYRGGGASHFLNVILELYKKNRRFLIVRQFEKNIYFYINDTTVVHQKYTVTEAIKIIKDNSDKIEKIFINSILSHEVDFLNSLFELNKKITAITHDYSLIFDKWNGYYHEYINKKYSSAIDVNRLDKLVTQNEANFNIYSSFLNDTLPIVISELPDYKHSLHRIETNNNKTVVGIIGNISEIKGFYLVYKLIELFKDSDEIEIVVFGRTSFGYENEHPYSNIDEFNELLCKYKPNIWIEASLWPETYSYTLSLLMLTQLPILYQKKPFPSVIENRLIGHKNKYEFDNIDMLLKNPNLIRDRKQNHFYTIDGRVYSNSFWDSYFLGGPL